MAIPVFRPTLKRRDMGSVLTCIVSDKLGPGELCRDLAVRASQLLGLSGGIAVTTPYLALSMALEALGLAAGDRVGLSALAPAAHLRVLHDRGLVPVLVDVDPDSGTAAPEALARLAERGSKAVILHHTLGIAAEVEAARALGLPFIEDVSHALGAKLPGGAPCGGAADATVVSLEPEGMITSGGGALVLARTRQAVGTLRRIAESSPMHAPLPDMNAALGVAQLGALERFLAVRREIAAVYGQALARSRHRPLVQKGDSEPVPWSFPVLLADGMKEARQYAMKKNVETLPAFADCAASVDEEGAAACPNARSLMMRCLLFPLYPMLAKRDVETVSKVLATLP